MTADADLLEPGLYLVSTPIGAARDITLRALDVLRQADAIFAEDTRVARHLLSIHGIPLRGRRIVAYNDMNGARRRPMVMERLRTGASVCYMPEAGTPLIADPGYRLVAEALAEGFRVIPVPGPTAAIAALTISGLPTDRFLFAGFLPGAAAKRQRELSRLRDVPATMIFYESAKRLVGSLVDMAAMLGGERRATICRELTKKHEESVHGRLGELAEQCRGANFKGEVVVVVEGPGARSPNLPMLKVEIADLLSTMTVRDAASEIAAMAGIPRSTAYRLALEVAGAEKGSSRASGRQHRD